VSAEPSSVDLSHVAVIIPALNEAQNLSTLLPMLEDMGLGQMIVCDNGSTDTTREVVEAHGGLWVYEPRRGYGAACFAGMQHLALSSRIVVFLDADLSDDPSLLPSLAQPIANDECDFVIGARVAELREPGSMTVPQVFANWLFPLLIRAGWGHTYTDMGPFRAIRRSSLDAVDMQDRAYGWTIEMQIRAIELGLRIREMPVSYRKRTGRSKISGTVRGVFLAAYWITRTCGILWLTKHRRQRRRFP
jgi:glycosyltransferase involved in cell wall biosynthesis